jgi:peptidoglycan/xylan/chitin deacetylase (PgdA/CDA1 family)
MKTLRFNPVYAIISVRTAQVSLLTLAAHWLWRWPLTGPHALGLLVTPLLCLYFVFVFVAPWSWGLPILTRLKTRERVVALTFDDGPSPEATPRILDILREHDVKATFFVLGERVARFPQILQRIIREGHAIGLHGWGHRALTLYSWASVQQELESAACAVHVVCPDAALDGFRPPYGFKSLLLPWLARRYGLCLVTWSLDPRDYDSPSPDHITQSFFDGLHPGAIVLLHDGAESDLIVTALPGILEKLSALGYRCVTLSGHTGFRE